MNMFKRLISTFKKDSTKKPKKILRVLLPSLITLLILTVLFAHFKIAPFGNKTLAVMDADIQYVDYFNYYKDVLDGKNTVGYTFSKELGGNIFGAFSYYLSSPINLLLKFFPTDKIELFFTFAVTLRLMLAALTFYLFLRARFKDDGSKKTYLLLLALSVTYALSSYSLQQASNLMWLDGVWLLPLMMLGVSKTFERKSPKLFIISSTCAFIFNWYSGFIALLFCVLWFFVELVLRTLNKKVSFKEFIKYFWQNGWRLLVSTMLAILISCIILVPSFSALGEGSRGGKIDWAFLHTDLRGKVFSTFANYYPGTRSNANMLSLFIGAIPVLTVIATFISKKVKTSHKIAYFAIISTILLIFYFNPLYFVFSLLKDVGSYWIRFSFGCFAILISLVIYILKTEKIRPVDYVVASILFFVSGLVFDYIDAPVRLRFYYSLFILTVAVLLYFYKMAKTSRIRSSLLIALSLLSFAEIFANSYLVMKKFNGAEKFVAYTISQEERVEKIKNDDNSTYRIHNLSQRCSFCLNDALSHNYKSIDGYTSSPDDKQIDLLHSLGYKRWFYQSNITGDSILSSDSLLGVKYFIDNSNISKNPYALPLVFSIPGTKTKELSNIAYNKNTFEYQNIIFRTLSGVNDDIYKKVDFIRKVDGDKITYTLDYTNSDNRILYSEIRSDGVYSVNLMDGNELKIGWYLSHPSPSVVNLSSNIVTLEKNEKSLFSEEKIIGENFYYLDLNIFSKVIKTIKANNKVTDLTVKNNKIAFNIDSTESQTIFTTIHSQKGWDIKVNDKNAKIELFNNSFILMDIQPGKNEIKFNFHLPGFKLGLVLFGLGIVSAAAYLSIFRKK